MALMHLLHLHFIAKALDCLKQSFPQYYFSSMPKYFVKDLTHLEIQTLIHLEGTENLLLVGSYMIKTS